MKIFLFCGFFFLASAIYPSNAYAEDNVAGSDFGLGVYLLDHRDPNRGVVVVGIDASSPAAGVLRVGDILNSVNGEKIPDPDLFSLYVGLQVDRHDTAPVLNINVERSIDRPFKPPELLTIALTPAYHGGNYDYVRYNSRQAALLAGFLSGLTYDLGPASYCIMQFLVNTSQTNEDINSFFPRCRKSAIKSFAGLKRNHPQTYQFAQSVGSMFFDINDLMGKSKGAKDEDFIACFLRNLPGAGIDQGIWQGQDGFIIEAATAIASGGDTEFIRKRMKNDALFAALEATVQCAARSVK